METDKNVQRDLIISKNKDNETMRQKIYYMVKIGTTYNWGMEWSALNAFCHYFSMKGGGEW